VFFFYSTKIVSFYYKAINNVLININGVLTSSEKTSFEIFNTPSNSMSPSSDNDSQFSSMDSMSSSSPLSSSSPQRSPSPAAASSKSTNVSNSNSNSKYNKSKSNGEHKKANLAKRDSMNESARVILCMFAMSILFFNPFNLIMPPSLSDEPYGGGNQINYQHEGSIKSRVLNSIDTVVAVNEETMFNSSSNIKGMASLLSKVNYGFYISWMLNFLLIIFCLLRVFVNGEPHLSLDKSSNQKIWLFYQRANKEHLRKNYELSFDYCAKGLNQLGQGVPITNVQLLIGVTWQLMRLLLHKIYIGRLLFKISKKFFGTAKNVRVYKLCALFYYELHKLSYIRNAPSAMCPSAAAQTASHSTSAKKLDAASNQSIFIANYARISFKAFLSSFYFLLAMHNACDVYLCAVAEEKAKGSGGSDATFICPRDQYNIGEFYFGMIVFFKLVLPARLAKFVSLRIVKKVLLKSLNDASDIYEDEDENKDKDENEDKLSLSNSSNLSGCKLNKLKCLLNNTLFIDYLIDFDFSASLLNNKSTTQLRQLDNNINYNYVGQHGGEQTKSSTNFSPYTYNTESKQISFSLSLIAYKRKLSVAAFLYDADDSFDHFDLSDERVHDSRAAAKRAPVKTTSGVATDFILSKFQDYMLIKMTEHIMSDTGLICKEEILSKENYANCSQLAESFEKKTLGEERDQLQNEIADVDQANFEKLRRTFRENLDYLSLFSERSRKRDNFRTYTESILMEFLEMLNSWKLRKFHFKSACLNDSKMQHLQNR
jgi:hypothetical protein